MELVPLGGPMRMLSEPEMMRGLFPGPLHIEFQDGGSPPGPAMPFQEPDPLVMDMLSNLDAVMQNVIPEIHRVHSASSAPASCHQDLSKHCSTARSQIHCLGQHSEDVSETCKKDVSHSVPFVCSGAIDKFCDVLQIGILDCLQSHTGELKGDCLDCVLATSKAINKLNSASKSAKPETSLLSAGAAANFNDASAKFNEAQSKFSEHEKQLQSLLDGMTAKMKMAKASENSWLMQYWKVLLGSTLLLAMAFVAFGSDKGMRMISSWCGKKGSSGTPLLGSGGLELPRPADEEML